MKTMRYLLATLPCLFALASCGEIKPEPEPEKLVPEIQLGKTEVALASDGAAVNVAYIIKNEVEGQKISVTNEADWLTVDAGKARIITLSATVNETGEVREASVVISYEGAEDVTLEVAQEFFVNPLSLSISGVTATGVIFSVTTSDEELTWIPMVTYKESFEYFDTDDELFQNDLEYFAYLADINDMTRAEFIEMMLATGSLENVDYGGHLQPSTDYVLYAYGCTRDGRRTTDIVSAPFRTEDPYEGDITFSFEASEEDYILDYTIRPSHTGVPYYYGIIEKTVLDRWTSMHNGNVREAIQAEEVDALIDELMDYGFIKGPEDYFSLYSESNVMDFGYYELTAATTYVIYAVKWDEQCRLTGPVSTYEHTSADIAPSDNLITLEVKNVTPSSADAVVTVTNDDPYVVMPIRREEIEGLTDEELIVYLKEGYDYIMSEYTFTGPLTKTFGRMHANTDYAILAFGFKAGTLTTSKIEKVYFTTLSAGDPAECTFEFNVDPDVDCAFVEVIPSDKGQWYHWFVYPSYYTKDDARNFIRMMIDQSYEGDIKTFSSWELSLGTDATTAWDLLPETEYKVGAIVMDYDTGEFLSDMMFSEPFMTLAKTYADLTFDMDYGPYYDLGALVKAGQTQFETLMKDADALMPIKVAVKGKCSAFYYALYANDLSDLETYPDEIFYAGLEGGGKSYASTNLLVKYDTPMTLVAVAYDYDNNPSMLYRDVLMFTQDGASPVKDFINSMKKAVRMMGVEQSALQVKMPLKEHGEGTMNLQEMEEKRAGAMAKVTELRREKLQAEMEKAMVHKRKMIAR